MLQRPTHWSMVEPYLSILWIDNVFTASELVTLSVQVQVVLSTWLRYTIELRMLCATVHTSDAQWLNCVFVCSGIDTSYFLYTISLRRRGNYSNLVLIHKTNDQVHTSFRGGSVIFNWFPFKIMSLSEIFVQYAAMFQGMRSIKSERKVCEKPRYLENVFISRGIIDRVFR